MDLFSEFLFEYEKLAIWWNLPQRILAAVVGTTKFILEKLTNSWIEKKICLRKCLRFKTLII